MIFDRSYDSMRERAQLNPNSTEAIALIAVNDELRRQTEEKRAARWARIRSLFNGRTAAKRPEDHS